MAGERRVWDSFLTERDHAHLSRQPPRRPVGFGRHPALLLIDNYRAAVGDDRLPLLDAISHWPNATGIEAWDALEAQQQVLGICRRVGVPVVHITGVGDTSLVPGWHHSVHAGQGRGRLDAGHARAGAHDIVDQVAPLPDEVVIRKSSPSAFWGTPLAGLLNYLGVDTLLVGGESTSGCVRATVVDAASYRYRVTVIEECVYDRHQAAHAINLFDMHQKYADVVTLPHVTDWLNRLSAET